MPAWFQILADAYLRYVQDRDTRGSGLKTNNHQLIESSDVEDDVVVLDD